ncbi:uncharacterized protein LTHEOB_11863 [Lasiodiplodia theobromae]|uniref:uncharacterized protein n=1 Tax=Lasiodiplodia theobromae TaxID=45133 RepID=UPI0015C30693|nr:uncharacterized protein LTHEOB_11863 [Lasiodiplodia theobromae]KAF4536856.1 hypothetical protein LTHEOB_11863 [Lasiodiplodia theobromae]
MSPPIKLRRQRSRKQNWKQHVDSTSPSNISTQRNSINISESELFKLVCSYEGFSSSIAPDITVREGLHNLEDVTAYGVSEEKQKELWKMEIARLSSSLQIPDGSASFEGTNELDQDTKDAYEILAHLADQMWIALNIAVLDCQSLLCSHFPAFAEESQLRRSQGILEQFTEDDDSDEEEESPQANDPKDTPRGSREDYFKLVDYITATMARTLCTAASGEEWHYNILSTLVKLSTKLKVVSFHLEDSASSALESSRTKKPIRPVPGPAGGRGAAAGISMGRNGGGDSLDLLGAMLDSALQQESGGDDKPYSGPNTRQRAVKHMYWMQTVKFGLPAYEIFRYILVSLRGRQKLITTSTTSYEICAMVYDTNFQQFSTLVYQDIDGEYLGSSRPENIQMANSVFEVLSSTMRKLERSRQQQQTQQDGPNPGGGNSSPSSTTTVPASGTSNEGAEANTNDAPVATETHQRTQSNIVGTTVSWSYAQADSSKARTSTSDPCVDGKQTIRLQSMSEVITVMIPLLLASPKVIYMMTEFIGLCVYTSVSEEITLHPTTKYKAIFCMSTEEYRKYWDEKPRSTVSQLSESLIARDAVVSRNDDGSNGIDTFEAEHFHKYQQDLHAVTNAMNDWIFEENGVRVRCRWYVWTVLSIASMLVLGGIASGLTIQDRLKGVDPFNITTFCWVVAAFVIVIAKSLRVANWAWRDFLRCNVLCRSVSELHSVTGIDEQLILGRLLQDESATRLQTRGPYNCVFTRQTSSADGFSIDHPMSIATMLLSGLIMIQVQAIYRGDFLVCLDLRKGTKYHLVLQSRNPTDKEEYISSDRLAVDNPQQTSRQRVLLQKGGDTRWNRVIGVYGGRDCFFT